MPRIAVLCEDEGMRESVLRMLHAERAFDLDRSESPDGAPPDVVVVVGAVDAARLEPWRAALAGTRGFLLPVAGPGTALPMLRIAVRRGRPPSTLPGPAPLPPPPVANWPGHSVRPVRIGSLRTTRWFSRAGEPLPMLPLAVVRAPPPTNPDHALLDALEEAQNQLSGPMSTRRPDRLLRWNEVAIAARAVVTELRPALEGAAALRTLPASCVSHAESVVLSAWIAGAFADTGHRCSFASDLLVVLRAGHAPTGWRGTWPSGALLVW
ncbi:MAG: hypothetical protein Q7U06_01150 [Pseudomonadota bacterium]|nr:hypothetical protein [Pseudomonadota bacterium]